jgi:tRNA(His) guanylyltransferase
MSDSLGDRLKSYEAVTTSRKAFRGQPFVIRLDGKSFSSYTRGLQRPYDKRLSDLMVEVTIDLVEEFGALVGYTQSDEITLGFFLPADSESQYMFDGKFQKLESLSAAYATAEFIDQRKTFLPGWKPQVLPIFDARAFVVPNLQELYHAFLWRQQDAVKNAISMAASAYHSHGALMGKTGDEKQEMLFQKGVNFNDYPSFFKRGTFVQRVKKMVKLTPEQLANIPVQHRPIGPVERTSVEPCDIWLTKEEDPVTRLFGSVR